MKPLIHAKSSVKRYGGVVEDYLVIHEWFDQTKAHVADVRHRAILHNAFGIYLCQQVHGFYFKNSDGKDVSVRDVGEDHVLEDLGMIPSLDKCFEEFTIPKWLGGQIRKRKVYSLGQIKAELDVVD